MQCCCIQWYVNFKNWQCQIKFLLKVKIATELSGCQSIGSVIIIV